MKQQASTTPTWLIVDSDKESSSQRDVASSVDADHLPTQQDQANAQNADLDIGRFVLALWTRKWMILALSSILFLIAAVAIMSIPRMYLATAEILIDPADDITQIQSISSPLVAGDSQAISSEVKIIWSNDIARQVVDSVDFRSYATAPTPPSRLDELLGLEPGLVQRLKDFNESMKGLLSGEEGPDEITDGAVMRAYYSTLDVVRVHGTYVIAISFETLDPEFSAEAANQLAAIYIANQIEGKKAARQQASALLSENLSKLETEIQRSNEEVEKYREQSGIDNAASTDLISQQLTLQTAQLVEARAVAQAIGTKLQNMEQLQQAGKFEELLSIVNSNTALKQWQEVLGVSRDLTAKTQEFGPNHPDIIRLNKELEDASRVLESEIRTALETTRIDAVVASGKVSELESSIIELRRSMTELKEKENQLQQLKADSDISRSLHELLTSRIREAESAVVEGPDARILNLAEVPDHSSSKPKRILLLGALLAAFTISSVAALGLEFLNGGYQTEEALRRSLGWPVLATVPKKSKLKLLGSLRSSKKASAYDEAFNILLTNLEIHGLDLNSSEAVVVMITSSIPAEGKSTIVCDLASMASEGDHRVLVIDADLRRPTVHKKFNVPNVRGLSSCDQKHLNGNFIKSLIVQDHETGVDVLPAGEDKVRPQKILKGPVLPQILSAERQNYDLIILDTPPVLAVSDALLVGKHCDAAVFVVKWSSSARRLVQRAMVRFSKGSAPMAGCVLTQVSKGAHRVGTYQYLDY